MRLRKRLGLLALPAIACSAPLAPAVAIPSLPNSDVLSFQDYTGVTNYVCTEGGPIGCEFIQTGIAAVSALPNGGGVSFTEPGSTRISDYVFVCAGFLAFASDDESGNISLPACAPASFLDLGPETGSYIDITADFTGYCLHPINVGACTGPEGAFPNPTPVLKFASDVDVPEPATWVVMLTGLLSLFGLGMISRRAKS